MRIADCMVRISTRFRVRAGLTLTPALIINLRNPNSNHTISMRNSHRHEQFDRHRSSILKSMIGESKVERRQDSSMRLNI